VNIGDPIEDIMISEYVEKILPRRIFTTACSFASRFGQEMAQNVDLSISCKNFSVVTPRTPALC